MRIRSHRYVSILEYFTWKCCFACDIQKDSYIYTSYIHRSCGWLYYIIIVLLASFNNNRTVTCYMYTRYKHTKYRLRLLGNLPSLVHSFTSANLKYLDAFNVVWYIFYSFHVSQSCVSGKAKLYLNMDIYFVPISSSLIQLAKFN